MTGRKPSKRPSAPGIPFEEAVAAVQRLMDPAATVTHDERLIDRLGHSRQFDVVLRANVGGHPILGVIECKDLRRAVGTPEVNAFADKARNLRANLVLMVSRNGFTQTALELAKHHGIGTFSLIPGRLGESGVSLGAPWYVTIIGWRDLRFTAYTAPGQSLPAGFDAARLIVGGQSILDWFWHKLGADHKGEDRLGLHRWVLSFREPAPLTYDDQNFDLLGVEFEAERFREYRTKRITWVGTALYNWETKSVMIPPNGHLESEGIDTKMEGWEVLEDNPPPMTGAFFMEGRVFLEQLPPAAPPPTVELADRARLEHLPPDA
jgi:hypothetical protein